MITIADQMRGHGDGVARLGPVPVGRQQVPLAPALWFIKMIYHIFKAYQKYYDDGWPTPSTDGRGVAATEFAQDCTPFSIGSSQFLAVMNKYNASTGATTTLSQVLSYSCPHRAYLAQILQWSAAGEFEPYQLISTNLAVQSAAFTIGMWRGA